MTPDDWPPMTVADLYRWYEGIRERRSPEERERLRKP